MKATDPFFEEYLVKIEKELDQLLTFPDAPQYKLYEAARYMTLSGGKRLRPLLVLATVSACNGPLDLALAPACALEMVHTYSLIHDDLPCMDDDDFRRGLPTLHKKFDEATAVLTGDFLLTYAFEVLSQAPGLSTEQKLLMVQTLALRSGGQGMIAGQMLDIESLPGMTLDKLKVVHQKKTADLLIAALEIGGIISNVSKSCLNELRTFGSEIGLAFQIIDDVIDLTDSFEKHGRACSSDELNGKTTYVSCLGLDGAKEAAHALLTSSLNRLDHFPNALLLKKMATSLVVR